MEGSNARPLTVAQVRDVDRYAIEHLGLPGVLLMENAARAVAEAMLGLLESPGEATVAILCGRGNNGGDGFAAARHLVDHVGTVRVGLLGEVDDLTGDPATNATAWRRCGQPIDEFDAETGEATFRDWLSEADVIVDALLGTGVTDPPREPFAAAIGAINASPARVVAADLPSGLDAETGLAHAPTVRADVTVTFVAAKSGFASEAARAVLREVVVAPIGVPREAIRAAI